MARNDEAIIKRIYALMQKTVDKGCTEDEAIAASKKVQELLHKYQLSLSDIELRESKCTTGEYDTGLKGQTALHRVIYAISKFTDTKCWFGNGQHGFLYYKYFGLEHDVLIAEYITKICDWAIIDGYENYKHESDWMTASPSRRQKMKVSFQIGIADRLNEKLLQMKKEQKQQDVETTGRDLVVVKGSIVNEEFAKLGLRLGRGKATRNPTLDSGVYNKGWEAGGKVSINPGVGANQSKQIGG